MKRKPRIPTLFIRDHDFDALLGSNAHREIAAARQDRAATWICYDIAVNEEAQRAAMARLQCRYAHYHRVGPEACPNCDTKQERTSAARPRPQTVEFVPQQKLVEPEEVRSALQRIVDDWE